MQEIVCKHCGCFDRVTRQGKGPHAYEIACVGCGKHIKWASAIDVESPSMTEEQIAQAVRQNEWAAIKAARNNNFTLFAASIKKRDKYLEKTE